MTSATTRPLWQGRILALLGIVLVALNLRTAVVTISPIVEFVSADVPLDSVGLGVLGALPPIAFALSGIVAPRVARRLGLENTLILACAASVVGSGVRAVAGDYAALLVGTILALAGMGVGNILLPPLVKKYFPDRIGLLTAVYATLLSLSASIPAIASTPLAAAAGWRAALAVWALVAVTALVPWLVVRALDRRAAAADAALVEEAPAELVGRLWRSPMAWALGLTLSVTALPLYSLFAWLPTLLAERAGTSAVENGALLALFAIVGLPAALLVPGIVARVRNVGWVILLGVLLFVAGLAGLLLAPTTLTALWVFLAGAGGLIFPICLTLINLRCRSHTTSVALSGFVQSVGYGAGALGPLVLGILHGTTGDWSVPLLFLIGFVLLGIIPAVVLSKPVFVEDDLARRGAA